MLARAAQRRLRHRQQSRQIAAAFNRLHLPWLCPAQLRWLASSSLSTQPQPLDSRRHPSSRHGPPHSVSRSLATVQVAPRQETPIYIPSSSSRDHLMSGSIRQTTLRPRDDSDILILNHASTAPPPTMMKIDGIGGDTTELHQNLHACLSVGRYNRAEAIVRRLADLFNPTTPELVEAHNVFMRGLTEGLAAGRVNGLKTMKKIRYWFEVEMRARGVAVNGNTYAIICRAAMIGLPRDAQVH